MERLGVKMKSALAALLLVSWIAAPPAKAQSSSSGQKQRQQSAGHVLRGPAPDFALESLNGETVHLSDFRGKVVLLNFWATWCGPCKILTPWFVDLQNQYRPQGLEIIGIALDEDATRVEIAEFTDNLRVNYVVLIGNEKVAESYGGIPAMPDTFFIGRDGKIVDRIIGLKGKGELEDSIKKALDPKPEPSEVTDVSKAHK
jgi:thiol-disulfide isomerase/thioredoxin